MISKKTKYGLNALILLAKEFHRGPVLISELSRKEKIPKKFLEHILLNLKKHGLLKSVRGKGGGYLLAKDPKEIYLGQAMRILEGPLAPVPCVSQTAYRSCDDCLEERCCGLRLVMKDVRDAMANILDNTSLADILERISCESKNQGEMYVI